MRQRADQSHDPVPSGAQSADAAQDRPPLDCTESGLVAAGPSAGQRSALLGRHPRLEAVARLIGDDSPTVRAALLHELRAAGRLAGPHLRRAARSDDPRRRSHARQILEALRQERVVRRLVGFAARGELDLERGLFLLSRLAEPALDRRPYQRALDAMAAQVESRARNLTDELSRARMLVEYLGQELGYRGDVEAYSSPDNVHLQRVITMRRGLPLSLCALYSFVARRCSIHTGIVPLPGHVMLRLYGRHQNLIVDPFHGGEAKSQEDLVQYLKQHGLRFDPVWMHDASSRMLFRRQVANLRNAWRQLGRFESARRLDLLLLQLSS